jgi:hypothetical protein
MSLGRRRVASAVVDHKRLGLLGIHHPNELAGCGLIGLSRCKSVRRAESFRVFRPRAACIFFGRFFF